MAWKFNFLITNKLCQWTTEKWKCYQDVCPSVTEIHLAIQNFALCRTNENERKLTHLHFQIEPSTNYPPKHIIIIIII